MAGKIKVFVIQPTLNREQARVKAEREKIISACQEVLTEQIVDVKPIGDVQESNPLLVLGANLQAMAEASLVVIPNELGYGSDEIRTLIDLAGQYHKARLMLHVDIDNFKY